MISTPFGTIIVTIDGKETEYVPVRLPIGGSSYSGATGRYAIPIIYEPDGEEHHIDCRLVGIPDGVSGGSDSGEDLECMTYDNTDESINLSIACQGETWEMGCTTRSVEKGYDYDTVLLEDGMRYIIMPTTKTLRYVFGICWKEGNITEMDADTWFGADPNFFGDYCIDPEVGSITYDVLLSLFKTGKYVDETNFYFVDDPEEMEHYLGYLPEYEKPYWAGYCDIEDGCEFETAEELFEAKIYDGKSLKDRWDAVALINIGGISVQDYYYSVPEVRNLFTEGKHNMRNAYDVVLKYLNEHDVCGLLSQGAPSDEYVSEAGMIAGGISKTDSVMTIAEVIAGVINEMFLDDKTAVDYLDIAREIKAELVNLNIRTEKYYCTRCGAILDEQKGFDPDEKSWVCKKCGQQLTGEESGSDVL